jgi:asparagine synthase (glutamine-hydrolysing)
MLSYQKWKEKCVNHLEGDWAAAFYLIHDNSLLLLKDSMGCSALYYMIFNESIFFSSDADMFPQIDSFQLTPEINQLIRLSQPGFSLEEGRTLYKGVRHIKNSEQVLINKTCISFSTFHAKINLQSGIVNFRFEIDYFLEYKSFFVSAIRSRLRFPGRKGIFLSGGMDSTAVLYFMGEESSLNTEKIFAYTSMADSKYLDSKNKIDDFQEFHLIQELSEDIGNVVYNYVSFPQVGLFEMMPSQRSKSGLNPIVSNNTFWIEGILRESKKQDIKRVFNGQLGNFTLTWNAPQLSLNQFLKLDLINLFKNLVDFSKKNKVSILKASWIEVFSQIYSYAKKQLYSLTGRSKKILIDTNIFHSHQLNAGRDNKKNLKDEFVPGVNFYTSPEVMRIEVFDNVIKHIGMQWYLESHRHALESVDPTSDSRFVEFSFKVPSKLFYSQGERKYIYRKVMKGLLPDSIINNNQTFKQSVDIRKRIISDSGIKLFIEEVKSNESLKKVFKLDVLLADYELIKSTEINIGLSFANDFLKNLSIIRFYYLNNLTLN